MLFIPALIALALYCLISYVAYPLFRRYRQRYDQYIPLQSLSDSVSNRTSSLRERLFSMLTAFVLPSVRYRYEQNIAGPSRRGSVGDDEEQLFGLEEAEDMVGFNVGDVQARREQLTREVSGMNAATRNAELVESHAHGQQARGAAT